MPELCVTPTSVRMLRMLLCSSYHPLKCQPSVVQICEPLTLQDSRLPVVYSLRTRVEYSTLTSCEADTCCHHVPDPCRALIVSYLSCRPLLSGQEVALQESVLEILRALLDPSSMTMKVPPSFVLQQI